MKRTTVKAQPMDRTWLVQRLHKPRTSGLLAGIDSPFSFGGGLRNGGLSAEAMTLLRGIWSFDYMGSAEFEFGAVPKALQGMADDARALIAMTITVDLSTVNLGWREQEKGVTAPAGEATVYVLCRRQQRDEVEQRIRHLATEDYTLKEATHFPAALRPSEAWHGDTVGWLELDNGFVFFTDEPMFEQTAALFGVEVPAAVTS